MFEYGLYIAIRKYANIFVQVEKLVRDFEIDIGDFFERFQRKRW